MHLFFQLSINTLNDYYLTYNDGNTRGSVYEVFYWDPGMRILIELFAAWARNIE